MEAAVLKQGLFTAADIGSKVRWGVMLSMVLRLRSAADGWEPALAAAEGAVGHEAPDTCPVNSGSGRARTTRAGRRPSGRSRPPPRPARPG